MANSGVYNFAHARVPAVVSTLTRRDLLAGALGIAALASRRISAAATTVRDAMGRSVTIPRPPRRIVTIFASNTELVAAIGLIDRIVGIDGLTTYPPEVARIRKVGGRLGFSIDAVVDQEPDLVIVTPARNAERSRPGRPHGTFPASR